MIFEEFNSNSFKCIIDFPIVCESTKKVLGMSFLDGSHKELNDSG